MARTLIDDWHALLDRVYDVMDFTNDEFRTRFDGIRCDGTIIAHPLNVSSQAAAEIESGKEYTPFVAKNKACSDCVIGLHSHAPRTAPARTAH